MDKLFSMDKLFFIQRMQMTHFLHRAAHMKQQGRLAEIMLASRRRMHSLLLIFPTMLRTLTQNFFLGRSFSRLTGRSVLHGAEEHGAARAGARSVQALLVLDGPGRQAV